MGYSTNFDGKFILDRPLMAAHKAYLLKLNQTRRMKRDPTLAAQLPDPIREEVGLPIGEDGEYFVGGVGFMGQDRDKSVVNSNEPPGKQPDLWYQWIPNEDGTEIRWDEGEKFYHYIEWLKYLIQNFLKPWGYTLNGEVEWQGEEPDDAGIIKVKDNVVRVGRYVRKVVYDDHE